jgi:hypothetical protein
MFLRLSVVVFAREKFKKMNSRWQSVLARKMHSLLLVTKRSFHHFLPSTHRIDIGIIVKKVAGK